MHRHAQPFSWKRRKVPHGVVYLGLITLHTNMEVTSFIINHLWNSTVTSITNRMAARNVRKVGIVSNLFEHFKTYHLLTF